MAKMGDFIQRGVSAPGLDHTVKWPFTPTAKRGDQVVSGQIIGTVPEKSIIHKVMVPPGVSGVIEDIKQGDFTVDETIAMIGGKKVTMLQKWPVRIGRPFSVKTAPDTPLVTRAELDAYRQEVARAERAEQAASRTGPRHPQGRFPGSGTRRFAWRSRPELPPSLKD